MASTSSISGLASGLDTATIINQLMTVEAQTQTALKTRLSTQQKALSGLQDLNAKIAAIATQASELSTTSSWQPLTATSSSKDLTATATSGSAAGSFDVSVLSTAVTHRLTFASPAASGAVVTGGSTQLRLTVGSTTTTLETGDGKLSSVVSALNASGTGVRASTITLDDGTQRLFVQSATSGAAGSFTLTASDGSDLLGGAAVRQGTDASITIGSDTLHSPTNTFASVLSGVSLTVSAAAVGTTATVDIGTDTAKVQEKVKGLVDAVNAALTQIDSLSDYDATTKKSGLLAGNPAVRALRNDMLQTVFPADGTSMAASGVQTTRDGTLVFDAEKFAKAYAADPNKVAAQFGAGTTPGFAQRVATVTKAASDTYSGTLTSSITGQSSSITNLQKSIDDWDTRLALRRSTLNQQFTALETALSQMTSQSQWLAGQISSLSSSSS